MAIYKNSNYIFPECEEMSKLLSSNISNTVLTQLNFGVNPVCIGSVADDANNNSENKNHKKPCQ